MNKYKDDYEKQAADFLKAAGAKLKITYLKTDRYFPDDKEVRDIYRVRIDRKGKSYSYMFGNSIAATHLNERPTKYDVLASVEKYAPYGDVWDFANEYGYEISDRDSFKKTERIYKACKNQAAKFERLFSDCYEQFCEIQ